MKMLKIFGWALLLNAAIGVPAKELTVLSSFIDTMAGVVILLADLTISRLKREAKIQELVAQREFHRGRMQGTMEAEAIVTRAMNFDCFKK